MRSAMLGGELVGRRTLLLLVALLMGGCASRVIVPSPATPGAVVSTPRDGVRVMESADGVFGSQTYTGSGRRLAGRVVQSLQGQFVDVQMLATTREADALRAARAAHAKFLVVPTILAWEDRNTAWSMNRDRLRVQLALRDVTSDRVVNSVSFEARSRKFFIFGDPAPDAMLDRSFDRAVLALLQR